MMDHLRTERDTDMNAATEKIADRCVVQIITIARFKRPRSPKLCNIHLYHVWHWRGGPNATAGLKCQCGLLSDPHPCPIETDTEEPK